MNNAGVNQRRKRTLNKRRWGFPHLLSNEFNYSQILYAGVFGPEADSRIYADIVGRVGFYLIIHIIT